MTTSTTAAEPAARSRGRRAGRPLLVLAFWLGVWQVAALVVDEQILLVGPVEVALRLGELIRTGDFWATVAHSLVRIGGGFAVGAVIGVLGASLAARFTLVDALTAPVVRAVRTTPVVSFIILVLMWADSGQLAFVISLMMVAPILWTTVLEGIRHRERSLLDMADVFAVPLLRRLPAIDVPAVLPYFIAGCSVAVGLAWKSGVAAEVIGLPEGSIGERLYDAKLFLSTADLFAWTVVVVALSIVLERLVVALLARLRLRLARGRLA